MPNEIQSESNVVVEPLPCAAGAKLGRLIAIEGIDGTGKSTQARRVADLMRSQGRQVLLPQIPDYEDGIGRALRLALQDSAFDRYALQAMFAAARLANRKQFTDALKAGVSIIMDRYRWSSVAYGVATGLSREWCASLEKPLPSPDLWVLLDLEPELASYRSGKKDFIERDLSLLARAREVYLQLAAIEDAPQIIIDASGDASSITHKIIEQIQYLFE